MNTLNAPKETKKKCPNYFFKISTKQYAFGNVWRPFQSNDEIQYFFFGNNSSEGSEFLKPGGFVNAVRSLHEISDDVQESVHVLLSEDIRLWLRLRCY